MKKHGYSASASGLPRLAARPAGSEGLIRSSSQDSKSPTAKTMLSRLPKKTFVEPSSSAGRSRKGQDNQKPLQISADTVISSTSNNDVASSHGGMIKGRKNSVFEIVEPAQFAPKAAAQPFRPPRPDSLDLSQQDYSEEPSILFEQPSVTTYDPVSSPEASPAEPSTPNAIDEMEVDPVKEKQLRVELLRRLVVSLGDNILVRLPRP